MKTVKTIVSLMKYYRGDFPRILLKALRWEYARRAPWVDLTRCRVFDYDMLVPTKVDGIGRALYVLSGRELDHKWMLEQVLQPGACIFDLGANIGYYPLLEAHILQGRCRIFTIEPDPRNVAILRRNLAFRRLESIVSIDQGAIASQDGEAEMVLDRRSNLSRLRGGSERDESGERVRVRVFNFKDYLGRLPQRVDLVRMDIEGGESEVFESLADMAATAVGDRRPRRIIFETHDYGSKRQRMAEILGRVLAGGYRVEYISSDDEFTGRPVIASYGYTRVHAVEEWGIVRGIYADIRPDDAGRMISAWRGTRTVCLRHQDAR